MEITLTAEQEAAVIKEHGTTDFLQTYVGNYADHLIAKQAEDDKALNIKILTAKTPEELAALVKPIVDAAVAAAAEAPAEP